MLRRTALAALVALVPSLALAWGYDGHRVVGEIATHHLTPKAAAAVVELLGDDTLAEAATWADEIKRQRPETSPWHYLNPPEGARRVTMAHCPDEGSVLDKLVEFSRVLADRRATHAAKVEALRFVAHFTGDIHCPMHVSREADKGGNDVDVLLKGKETNLHASWDTGIIKLRDRTWQQIAEVLAGEIEPEQVKAWGKLDPEAWATESYTHAMSFAYKVVPDAELEPAYIDQAQNIIDERLQMAGVRLAAILNRAFRYVSLTL